MLSSPHAFPKFVVSFLLSLVVGGGAVTARLQAQSISVYPHLIVVDARTHTASVTLANSGSVPTEVVLSTFYGYPATDVRGNLFLKVPDTAAVKNGHFAASTVVLDTTRSAASWVQVLPERLIVPPRGRRTVRLLIDPQQTVPHGEYWARFAVTIQAGTVPVQQSSPGVQSKLALKIRTVFPIVYRTGTLTTAVQVAKPHTTIAGDSLITRTLVTRTGNAAYLGSLVLTLRDGHGKVWAHRSLPLSVYFTLDPRLALPIHGLPSGPYMLDAEMRSTRPDIPKQQLLQSATVHTRVRVTIP